jgi:hypothetical protein
MGGGIAYYTKIVSTKRESNMDGPTARLNSLVLMTKRDAQKIRQMERLYCFVQLGFSFKSLERPTEVQQFPEFRAGQKKSSGSPNEVDIFEVKSQLIYFQYLT